MTLIIMSNKYALTKARFRKAVYKLKKY